MLKKSQFIKAFGPLGVYSLARSMTRSKPKILMYHRFSEDERSGYVSKKAFERQVAHIARHYSPISLTDLVNNLRTGRALRPNSIVITVDDGYLDFYEFAYPILRKYKVPATFFVTTNFVDGEFWLWPDKISWLLEN